MIDPLLNNSVINGGITQSTHRKCPMERLFRSLKSEWTPDT